MIDYDSISHCHLTDIFFAIFVGAKELKKRPLFLVNSAKVKSPRKCCKKALVYLGTLIKNRFCVFVRTRGEATIFKNIFYDA